MHNQHMADVHVPQPLAFQGTPTIPSSYTQHMPQQGGVTGRRGHSEEGKNKPKLVKNESAYRVGASYSAIM